MGTRDIFSFSTVQTGCEVPPSPFYWLPTARLAVVKRPGREFDLSPPSSAVVRNESRQGCPDSGHRAARAIKFCIMVPNICGPSVWNLLHVTLLTLRILRWQLDFSKICLPLSELYLLSLICLHSVH